MRSMGMALALGLLCGTTGWSQESGAPRRQGFWISGGLGYGSAAMGCDQCRGGSREDGVGAFIALGGTPSQHLLLGVESNGWFKEESGVTLTLGTLTFAARYYPSVRSGFFLKGGAGVAVWEVSAEGASRDKGGLGLIGGLGYDIPVGGKLSITPTVSYSGGWLGTIDDIRGVTQNVIQVAVALTAY